MITNDPTNPTEGVKSMGEDADAPGGLFLSGTPSIALAERAAMVAWLRQYERHWHQLASLVDRDLNPIERAKTKSTEMAFGFIRRCIANGTHIEFANRDHILDSKGGKPDHTSTTAGGGE